MHHPNRQQKLQHQMKQQQCSSNNNNCYSYKSKTNQLYATYAHQVIIENRAHTVATITTTTAAIQQQQLQLQQQQLQHAVARTGDGVCSRSGNRNRSCRLPEATH